MQDRLRCDAALADRASARPFLAGVISITFPMLAWVGLTLIRLLFRIVFFGTKSPRADIDGDHGRQLGVGLTYI